MTEQALADLKVLEYGTSVSSSFCAKLMADLGADVIKIESPSVGDPTRQAGPFPGDNPDPEQSGLFLYLNTNKRGITLDADTEAGVKTLHELIAKADVLIEDVAPAEVERLGLDYEALARLNPGLVVTSITAFGRTGPYSGYKGNDLICCNMSGIAYHSPYGGTDAPISQPPLKPGGRQSDFAAGSTAATATMFAVIQRWATGTGQHVDVSQQEAIAAFLRHQYTFYTYDPGELYLARYGSRQRVAPPMIGYLQCRDGYVANGCREGHQWLAFLEMAAAGKWESVEEIREALTGEFDLMAFIVNVNLIRPTILEWVSQHTVQEITEMAQAKRVPLVPCNTAEEVFQSSHIAARGALVEIEHPVAGRLTYPGAPYKFSETPWRVDRPAPLLGEHNEEVLCGWLGYGRQELTDLRESGTI